MSPSTKSDLIVGAILVTIILVVLASIIAIALGFAAWQCHRRWDDSGMRSRWNFGTDCQVQRKDGTWVPERVVRDIGQGA